MQFENGSEILASAPICAEEEKVVKEIEWGAIRTLYERGKSKKAIARELGLDIKTVRKWLKGFWKAQSRRSRERKLDPWREFLEARAPEVGFNAVVLFRELESQGYEGSYPSLVKYIRPSREEWRHGVEPTVRFETSPGDQSQVDWGQTLVWVGEKRITVHLFTMVLGFSRRIFVKGYVSERMDSLLDGHASAFEHFGGRTRTILYDNPRTIVLEKDEASGRIKWNQRFKDRMDFYGVEIRLCRYYRAQTKGKVESGVKYVKRNALVGRRFTNLEELNRWLVEWCVTYADERIHGTTHERPSERFKRAEAATMIEISRNPMPQERVESRIVGRDGNVLIDTNRYPVPLEWVNRRVDVRLVREEVIITIEGSKPLTYQLLEGRYQVARWQGETRSWQRSSRVVIGPPRLDPVYRDVAGSVEVRGLEVYEAIAEEVAL